MQTTPTIQSAPLETTRTALVVNVGTDFENRAERVFAALVDLSRRYVEFMTDRHDRYDLGDLAGSVFENVDFFEEDPADVVAELPDAVIIHLGDPDAFGDEAGAWFAAIVDLTVRYAQLTMTIPGEVGWSEVADVLIMRSARSTFVAVAENLEAA